MDESKEKKDELPSEAESSIAEMYKLLNDKYEAELKARKKAEADVVCLTKIIRTMEIKPAETEKEETIEDLSKKLFN